MKAMKAAKGAYELLGLGLASLKIYADFKKHRQCEADVHSQKCECFQQCLPCLVTAAKTSSSSAKP